MTNYSFFYSTTVSKSLLIVWGTFPFSTQRGRTMAPFGGEGHCPPTYFLKKNCISKNIHLGLISILLSFQSKRRYSNCSAQGAWINWKSSLRFNDGKSSSRSKSLRTATPDDARHLRVGGGPADRSLFRIMWYNLKINFSYSKQWKGFQI